MIRVYGREKRKAVKYLTGAALVAAKSGYPIPLSGSILVKRNRILGRGSFLYENKTLEDYLDSSFPKENEIKNNDKFICTHSAQEAINSALDKYGKERIKNSTLYYIDIDSDKKSLPAKKPSCAECSKKALDIGIKNWILIHDKGIYSYSTREHYRISLEEIEGRHI